jgi:hypothetical protein
MGTSLLARVVARTGAAVWKHRVAWLLGGLLVAGAAAYLVNFSPGAAPTASADCADKTMAAVASTRDETARAAYACLGTEMRGTDEESFVQQLTQRGQVPRGRLSRIGDHPTVDGGRIVFYAVDIQGQSVGYVVYVNPEGKVERIE